MLRALILVSCVAAAAAPALASPDSDLREAQAVLEQAVKEHPKNAELLIHLGFVYRKLDRLDEAQDTFERAVVADPKKAEAYYMLGLLYEKKGLKEKAAAAWQSCLASTKDDGMLETARKHLHVLESTKH